MRGGGQTILEKYHKKAQVLCIQTFWHSTAPIYDPNQQALYHYIATGSTLEPHYYRQSGSTHVPDVKKFIEEKLQENTDIVNSSLMAEDPAIESVGQANIDEDEALKLSI